MLALLAFLLFDIRSASHHAAQSDRQPPESVADEIIVRFQTGVDEFTKDLSRFRVSGTRKKIFKIIPGLEVVKLRPGISVEEAIALYEQVPGVLYAEPNYKLHLTANETTATPNDPSFGSLWGLSKINAPGAWDITTGNSNVVVATLDTGIDYTHPDLATNIWRNTADCNTNGIDDDDNGYVDDCHGIDTANDDSDPRDDHTHGTHVAGTIGAVGNNGVGVVGVNWNVKIMACKFFDASGSATTEGAIECLQYVKMMKERGVNVVATSNSWGGGEFSQSLYEAVDVQRQNGILFIAGAGNGNFFGIGQNNDTVPFYPCSFYLPNIICVAATASNDSKGSFSNYGRRSVHLGAPGVSILSTLPGNSYGSQSGTSMATPHVSGLAALLKAQDVNRDWRAIKNLILTGGNTISSMSNTISGKRINANGAMTCSNTVVQSRVHPISNTIEASPGIPVHLGHLNVRCASGNGNVNVTVSPGNQTITLLDNGAGSDPAAGDGIYSAEWIPETAGTYTLTFPGNDSVTVNVANPTIEVTPTSIDFGGVAVGSSVDKSFTVTNTGGGVLSGSATINAPYSVVSGGTYSLGGGESQTVVVRFSPTALGTFAGNINFSGGEGTSANVNGTGVPPATIALEYNGKLRDRVGQGDQALGADGSLDGTFTVTVSGGGTRTVTRLDLSRSGGGNWDTVPAQGYYWALGAAQSLDAPLYNAANTSVSFAVANGGSFNIFASDQNNALYGSGSIFTLKVTFADGTSATASVSVSTLPPATIALGYNGRFRPRETLVTARSEDSSRADLT
jgi:hypothetical protein